jgi:putative tryptophan/tyrosine transport system substrate-binding protein
MKRREFISLISGAAITAPFGARAQQPTIKAPHIGIIDDAPIWDHFRHSLRDLGYVDGRNIVIDYRSAQGDVDQLRQAARELASLPVNVLVAYGTPAKSNFHNSNRHD